jgi:SAM-dependent methyltransferase
MSVFGQTYSGIYDHLYAEKNYDEECAALQRAFEHVEGGRVTTVLDLGCGTGNHSWRLASRGFDVTGVDRSESMIDIARGKGKPGAPPPRFLVQDLRELKVGQTFDAAIMMFAVLGYMTDNDDVLSTLRGIRRHLRPGGVLVFDVWYGPGVLRDRPGQRVRELRTPHGVILRMASGQVDTQANLCAVSYRVWRIEEGRVSESAEETHLMRYFFMPELRLFLTLAGLELVRCSAFPREQDEPSDGAWNILVTARASANDV